MSIENKIQEFILKNIDKTRNYFLEEIEQKELMSRKHKKVCNTLNYIKHNYYFYNYFYNYWMYLSFCFRFFDWYCYKNYEFCNRIKKKELAISCRNY